MIRRLAVVYALGVVLACPAALHADDPPPAAPVPAPAAPSPAPAQPAPAPAAPAPAAPAVPSAPAPAAPAPAQPTAAAEPEAQPAQAPKAVASAATVSMRDFSFAPGSVTVNVGESVTWVNNGQAPHNAVGDGVSTPLLQSGESDSQTFSSAGTFSYICTIHPQMKGTVTVQASSSGGSGGSSGGSGAGSTGSGSDAGATAGTTESGTSGSSTSSGAALPATGADAWLFAAIGVVMLGFGIALRDRSRTA